MRGSSARLRHFVVALLAAIILAGCGADEEDGTTSKTEKDGGGNGTTSKTEKARLIAEVCDEAGCTGATYREGDRVFLCRKLEIDRKVLPGPSGETAEPNDGEPDKTIPSNTVTTTTVLQPRCVGGAIPVEGLHYDELPGVEKPEDGATAWTREPVFIEGKIEDGKLQAAE